MAGLVRGGMVESVWLDNFTGANEDREKRTVKGKIHYPYSDGPEQTGLATMPG